MDLDRPLVLTNFDRDRRLALTLLDLDLDRLVLTLLDLDLVLAPLPLAFDSFPLENSHVWETGFTVLVLTVFDGRVQTVVFKT